MAEREDPGVELLQLITAVKTRFQLDLALNRKIPTWQLRKMDSQEKADRLSALTVSADPVTSPEQALADVRAELGECRRCPLCDTRNTLVFGEGHPHARLVFAGEAPGADEDMQGRPFVGKAGQLLTRIIAAMGLQREDVYICNILKCRPPGNRNPKPDEIAACEPYLIRQISAIQPKVICALGTFASHTLLKTEVPISLLRGRFHRYQGIPLMPTYHPAYLLRNPGAKKQVWEDVQMIMKEL